MSLNPSNLDAETAKVVDNGTGNTKLLQNSDRSAHIADASTAHALNSTFSDTEVETALNALGTKINAILDVLEAAGLTKTS